MIRRLSLTHSSGCAWLCLFVCAPTVAQPIQPTGIERAARIRDLVGGLESDRAVIRDRAMRRLIQLESLEVVKPMVDVTQSRNVETTARVVAILREYSLSADEQLAEAAYQALSHIAQRSRVGVLARNELRRYSVNIRDRLIHSVESSGGTMTLEPSGHAHISLNAGWSGGARELRLIQRFTPIRRLSLERSKITDKLMTTLAGLDVERLYLGQTQISHRGLAALGKMPSLKYLSLERVRLRGIPQDLFLNFPNLELLGLGGADVTDTDVAALAQLGQLRTLILDNAAVTDRALKHLRAPKKLVELHLKQTQVTGTGFGDFPKSQLHKLLLKSCPLSHEGLSEIGKLTGLRELGIDHTAVGDAQLAPLANLPSLETLWLSKTKVTDAGIQQLGGCNKLETIYVHGAAVTSDGRRQLRERLPDCRVEGVQSSNQHP